MDTKQLTILDEDYYPDPERINEDRLVETTWSQVERGDRISVLHASASDRVVHHVKTGTKWTEVFDANDNKFVRALNTEPVTVIRRFETDFSRTTRRRAHENQALARKVQPHLEQTSESVTKPVSDALARALDKTQNGFFLRSSEIEDILLAQAAADVHSRWIQAAQWRGKDEDFTGDLVDVLDEFIQHLKDNLASTHRQRALSRSTSVMDNLMVDVESQAMANFIDQSRWLKF